MNALYEHIVASFEKGRSAVLATMIRQAGPSPRHLGAKCLILDDGEIVGTIGGGLLEAGTIEAAGRVLKTGLPMCLHFSLKGIDVADTDMLCGGNVDIFLEPVLPADPSAGKLYKRVAGLVRRGGTGLIVTVIDETRWRKGRPAKAFFEPGGEAVGELKIGSRAEDELRGRLRAGVKNGQPAVVLMKDDSGALVPLFVEPFKSDPALYVFGGGHVSSQIVPLASRVGFSTVVIDDRPEFAESSKFPDAKEVRLLEFEHVMKNLPVDSSSFLVIVTRGHLHDKSVLTQALRTDARYIGMIGSRRKRDIIYEKLLEEGFAKADLARVHSPIGLDIGAETPAEIAVSIVAELILKRAGGGKY